MPPAARTGLHGPARRKTEPSGIARCWTDCRPRPLGDGNARAGRADEDPAEDAEMVAPIRGEVWLIDLNPVRGHEQAGRRPALVVSDDLFNQGPAGLVIVLPITSTVL